DGPGANEQVPVVLARLAGEGGRRGNDPSAGRAQTPIELRETQVVADREPDRHVAELRQHDVLTGRHRVRLAVPAPIDVHVEEVELPIARGDRAVGVDGEARVEEPLVARRGLQKTPADDVEMVPALYVREASEVLADSRGGR